MTDKTKEALKLALEALKKCHYYMIDAGLPNQSLLNEAFTAATVIREALAEQPARPQTAVSPDGGTGFLNGVWHEPAQPKEPDCDRSACGDFTPGPCDYPDCYARKDKPAQQEPVAPQFDIKTSAGGRGFVEWYFSRVLKRHDFTDYIRTVLAADFACALAKGMSASPPAQPQQEPVAWMTQARNFAHLGEFTEAEAKLYGWSALYTSPPAQHKPWVGLTEDERTVLWANSPSTDAAIYATETKLKEKNI